MATSGEKKTILLGHTYTPTQYIWAFLRLGMGWLFLWAFVDKLFGLGFATPSEQAWIAGGSPTTGFLLFATRGPLVPVFQRLAGNFLVDLVFMLSLLLLGLTLILGIGVRIAGYGGALLVFLMYLAALPPEHNPILDDHILYLVILLGLTRTKAGHWLGFGDWWANTNLVQKFPILE
ncbi:MAG: hypothetical protein ACE5I5_06530 [Candidatus Heimdallarchaeota archaeon]